MTPSANPQPPPLKRSGSQKRQRTTALKVAMTPDELSEVKQKATPSGLSPSSYGRAVLLGTPGPRAKRQPPVNAQLFGHAIAALNKAGSNLNQIAHILNAGGALGSACSFEAVLAEVRAAAADIRQIVGRKSRV